MESDSETSDLINHVPTMPAKPNVVIIVVKAWLGEAAPNPKADEQNKIYRFSAYME